MADSSVVRQNTLPPIDINRTFVRNIPSLRFEPKDFEAATGMLVLNRGNQAPHPLALSNPSPPSNPTPAPVVEHHQSEMRDSAIASNPRSNNREIPPNPSTPFQHLQASGHSVVASKSKRTNRTMLPNRRANTQREQSPGRPGNKAGSASTGSTLLPNAAAAVQHEAAVSPPSPAVPASTLLSGLNLEIGKYPRVAALPGKLPQSGKQGNANTPPTWNFLIYSILASAPDGRMQLDRLFSTVIAWCPKLLERAETAIVEQRTKKEEAEKEANESSENTEEEMKDKAKGPISVAEEAKKVCNSSCRHALTMRKEFVNVKLRAESGRYEGWWCIADGVEKVEEEASGCLGSKNGKRKEGANNTDQPKQPARGLASTPEPSTKGHRRATEQAVSSTATAETISSSEKSRTPSHRLATPPITPELALAQTARKRTMSKRAREANEELPTPCPKRRKRA